MSPAWQETAKAKKAAQAEQIPKEWRLSKPVEGNNVMSLAKDSGLLTDKELEITNLDDLDTLVSKIASGKWSSYEVTLAYCKRAALAQQAVNCLTEMFFDRALERAKELDEHLKKTGKVVGPLHGVPVSLKDQVEIKGVECCMAYVAWIGRISDHDAVMTQILLDAGAVLYVKTNVPVTLMCVECDNYIFGKTTNPRNRTLTCGGSTGGEGALIGFKGSIVGVGSDIGGSIRIPCSCNNLFGLRGTMRRLPYYGSQNSRKGSEAIESVLGPMARSLSGVTTFTKTIVDGRPWEQDPTCVEIPWRQDLFDLKHLGDGKKLSFGIMKWDKIVMPHPPILRAIDMVVKALKEAGHEVIPWEPIDPEHAKDLISALYDTDGGEDFKRETASTNEPLHPQVFMDFEAGKTVYESWQLNQQRDAYRKKALDKWMQSKSMTSTGRPIDAFISPVQAHVAAVCGTTEYLNYTTLYNLLDYPSCVFPVTTVDQDLDKADPSYKPVGKDDEINWKKYDSPETYKDAPVCLQLSGRRFREEEVLGMVKVIDDALRK